MIGSDPSVTTRPWGAYADVAGTGVSHVKVLVVEPGHRLSLQRHRLRGERWMPLDEGLSARIGDWSGTLEVARLYDVPVGEVHRLQNFGVHPARLVEVMFGVYDEADIVRLADDYDRRVDPGPLLRPAMIDTETGGDRR